MTDSAPPPLPTPPWERDLPTPVEARGVQTYRSLTFAAELGYRPLALDLYLPTGVSGPLPVVVFIHGGAFLLGSRDELIPEYGISPAPFERVARAGFAVASLSYRLSSEATFPAQLHDVAAGVRFLVARADELGLDPGRIGVWGVSAGAHLSLLLAQLHDQGAVGTLGAPVTLPPFAAIVDWFGITDVRDPIPELQLPPPSVFHRLLGADPASVPELAALASPVVHTGRPLAHTLVMHGVQDGVVPIEHSRVLADLLGAAGTPVERVWFEGAGHVWLGTPEIAEAALQGTLAFLRSALGVEDSLATVETRPNP